MSRPATDGPPSTRSETEPAAPAPRPARWDTLIRIAGGVVVVYAAFVSAVIESFLVPFKIGGSYLPVAAVLAVAGNIALPYLMLWWCRVRLLSMLPCVVWFAVVLAGSAQTDSGSIVIPNIWPGPLLLVSGAATVAVMGYKLLLGPPPVRDSIES